MTPQQITETFTAAFPDHNEPVTREWCGEMCFPVTGQHPTEFTVDHGVRLEHYGDQQFGLRSMCLAWGDDASEKISETL